MAVKQELAFTIKDRRNSQGFLVVEKQTVEELEELIKRQNKLLKNRNFIEKLPDKGKKILEFKSHLEREYDKKIKEYDAACQLMSKLNLSEELEWNQGKVNDSIQANAARDKDEEREESEKEKDEVNPLKLLASHSGTAKGNKKLVKYPNETSNKTCYGDKICMKYGACEKYIERFKPNQLKNNEKSLFATSAEKVKKILGSKWEITEATPPVPVYKDTIMISLPESLKLQKEHSEKLKEIEKNHATMKLLENKSLKVGIILPKHDTTEYREPDVIVDEYLEDKETYLIESEEEF